MSPYRATRASARAEVAIAHDFLVERGGAERVALELTHVFPAAPIHTTLFRPGTTHEGFDADTVNVLVRDPLRLFRHEHRSALPLAIRSWRSIVIDADLTICSTSGLSHLARTTGAKVVYCHTPARWLHRPREYFRRRASIATVAGHTVHRWLADADRAAMQGADLVLVNSDFTRDTVRAVYGLDATVVPPVTSLSADGEARAIHGIEPGFVLTPSRLLSYKRLDVLLDAARTLPRVRFVIVGDGPARRVIQRSAPANVTMLGPVDDAALRWAYRTCGAVAMTSADDFGLVVREGAAFGKPVLVPDAGGYREQLDGGLPGVPYRFADASALACALSHALGHDAVLPQPLAAAQEDFRQTLRRLVGARLPNGVTP